MGETLAIRAAEPGDAAAIGAIYDEAAASGLATFATGPHPAQERRAWLRARGERAPVWSAAVADRVVGWSALAPFSHRAWYSGVAEYTVYVARSHQGRGLGRRMLDALIEAAPAYGYWKLVGMILPENAPGLALARGAGFRVVGTHRAHARREGVWRDVTIVERHLEVPGTGTWQDGLPESSGTATDRT
jgi:L-amino acid N-acyltransferase YncA